MEGLSAPWYTLDDPGFERGPAVGASRATTTGQPVSVSAVWSQVDADGARLLVVRTNMVGPAVPPWDAANFFEVDTGRGEWWTFESFGMSVEERDALARSVYHDGANGFVLPDPSFQKLAEGPRGRGSLLTQAYAAVGGRVTISVGTYRGQLDRSASQESIVARSFDGHPGFQMVSGPDVREQRETTLVWDAGDGQWAHVSISGAFLADADRLAEALVTRDRPDGDALLPSEGGDGEYWADVLVTEHPDQPPMIAYVFEGPVGGGGSVPLAHWSWDDVLDEESGAGHVWGGPWRVFGRWDGSTFTVTRHLGPIPRPEQVVGTAPTPACDQEPLADARARVEALAWNELAIYNANLLTWDGDCGLIVSAIIDSPELREQLAPFSNLIEQYDFLLHPVG